MNQTKKDPTEPPKIVIPHARFELGNLYLTPGANDTLTTGEITIMLGRHALGDWGLCCPQDYQANEDALRTGARLFSIYKSKSREKIWVITEADRSATTFLLPSEY